MSQDEVLKARIDIANERKTRYLAEEVERRVKIAERIEVTGCKRKAEKELPQEEAEDKDVDMNVPEAEMSELADNRPRGSADVAGAAPPCADIQNTAAGSKRAHEEIGVREGMTDETVEAPVTSKRRLNTLEHVMKCLHHIGVSDLVDSSGELCLPPDVSGSEWLDDVNGPHHEHPEDGYDLVLVQAAKEQELQRFKEMNVYEEMPRSRVAEYSEPVTVGARWVITNKGTKEKPVIKARLVAQEFAHDRRADLYAGTPGLSTVKLLMSNFATRRAQGWELMVADVKSAFLYGDATRNIFVNVPEDVRGSSSSDTVWKLRKAMYGTRDAPQSWQNHIYRTLEKEGFTAVRSMAGVFVHHERQVQLCTHVDDFLVIGPRSGVRWTRGILKKHYEVKTSILGHEGVTSCTYLGRTLSESSRGLVWTADAKHAQALLEDTGMTQCKPMNTPLDAAAVEGQTEEDRASRPELPRAEARRYRACAARINYMSQDRPDLSLISCVLAKRMAVPREGDEIALKRAVRYIQAVPFLEQLFEYQDINQEDEELTVYTDSDWAVAREDRRSHSGGAVMRGKHCLSHWCRVQHRVALSSGEAELYSAVKGLSELLLFETMMSEIYPGLKVRLKHVVDASACRSMLLRRGLGDVKHLDVKALWAQEVVRDRQVCVIRVPRAENLSDTLCSVNGVADRCRALHGLGFRLAQGQNTLALAQVSRRDWKRHACQRGSSSQSGRLSALMLRLVEHDEWSRGNDERLLNSAVTVQGWLPLGSRGGVNVRTEHNPQIPFKKTSCTWRLG